LIVDENSNFVNGIFCHGGIYIGISRTFCELFFCSRKPDNCYNETGVMMGNQTNQTGNETQQGPLEQLGETLGGVFGGGNQSQ
jgi:hypothetical protein